mmetsp:Transcript_22263/g.56231  ORF Transcript_22263/g.56231 Transcript_22263/m.56231 type:complete len:130 (+) Transcript_22263:100-489(+)
MVEPGLVNWHKVYDTMYFRTSYERGMGSAPRYYGEPTLGHMAAKQAATRRTHFQKKRFFPRCHSFPNFASWRDVDAAREAKHPQPQYFGTEGVVLTKSQLEPSYGHARMPKGFFTSKSAFNLYPNPKIK